MKKTKLLLLSLLAVVMTVACVMFAACGGTKYKIDWKVENATVSVEGYTERPDEVKEGDLVFTVKPADGYEVDSVLNGTNRVNAKDGKYTVSIKADTTITVNTKKAIDSVVVATNPSNLTYVAGESLDKTGMVVTVNYKTGDKENVDNYTVSPATFSAGDTSFTVTYGGVSSAAVNLDATVQGVITLDPVGGTFDSKAVEALSARQDLTVETGANGVITIKYTALTAKIELPSATKGEKEGDFNFAGYQTVVGEDEEAASVSEIAADYKGSYNLEIKWDARLVTINSMRFEQATVGDKTGPFLVLNVKFEAADSAYLYLYEGNDKVSLKGDTYTKDASKETQDLYFYLPTLGEYKDGDYNGKWMDVLFNAEIEGREYSQSFPLDHDDPIAEVGPTIQDSVNSYTLLTYRSNGVDYIKLAFKPYTSTYGFAFDGDNMTVSGKINTASATFKDKEYAGGTASLKLGESDKSGAIAADGTWSITYKISEIGVVGAGVMPSITFADKNGDSITTFAPSYTAGTTAYDYDKGKFGNPSYYSAKHVSGGLAVYVGNMGSDWQNALFAVIDEGHAIDYSNMKLIAGADGKPMVQFSGTYGTSYTAAEAKAAIEKAFYYDIQNYDSYAYRYYSSENDIVVTTNADNTFTVVCNIMAEGEKNTAFQAGDSAYGHFGGASSNLSMAYTDSTVTYDGLTFTLGSAQSGWPSWLSSLTIIYVTAAE